MSMGVSTNLYAFLGVLGCIFAPLLGTLSDKYAGRVGNETVARRRLMFVAPACGLLGMACLLLGIHSLAITILACVFFAMYWQGMPAQVTGYMGFCVRPEFPEDLGSGHIDYHGHRPCTGQLSGREIVCRVRQLSGVVYYGAGYVRPFGFLLPSRCPRRSGEMEQRSDG